MAEERIVCRVIEKGPNCDYCFSKPAESYYYCSISNNYCSYDVCKQCSLGMTRARVIEKMAKALYTHTWKSKTPMVRVQNWEIGVTEQNKKKYLGLAEAALDALLEGK